ncbi:alpha/beta fold hydrolase [Rhizobium helianthi]|uniref:Alpha/beta fold hydrolase n=1 Tax=Rhizobium helianthi TaxID=1132695 RepID=A0ABW4M5G8_9HYPH
MRDDGFGYLTSDDGLRLAYREFPATGSAAPDLPVVCLPGLTRNSRDFEPLARQISQSAKRPRRVICLDYRGRGRSDWAGDKTSYNIVTEARDVLKAMDHLDLERAIFIGTSRGGLIMHILAQMALERMAAGILNDVGPELGVEGLREIQAYLKEAEPLPDWKSATEGLKALHGSAFPALSSGDWEEFAEAIFRETEKGIVPDCDPAIGQAFAAMNLDKAIPDLWPQFDLMAGLPLLLIRGVNSKLLTASITQAMQARHTQMAVILAKGQGHAPLLHLGEVQPALQSFLDTLPC